jgi:hypothetical protein
MIIANQHDADQFRFDTIATLKLELANAKWVAGVDVDGGRKLISLPFTQDDEHHLRQVLEEHLEYIVGEFT